MLLIIMHKNRDYLQSIVPLIKKENVPDVTIIERSGIGSLLEGDSASTLTFREGGLSKEYDKALIALVDEEKKIEQIMSHLEDDKSSSRWRNFNDKAFVCTLPYVKVKHLEQNSFYAAKKEEDIKMEISEYLKEENISLDIKGRTKEEVIREMSGLLKEEKDIIDFDAYVSAVYAREKLVSTGIGNEIAIPHARTNTVENVVIAFGRSRKGINFDSIDKKPVKLIFLIGTPEKKKLSGYMKLLAHLSRLLKKENFRKALLTAGTPKEILNEFKRVES